MTKITVDKALIEMAIEAAFSPYCTQDLAILVPALRAALAEPAVETVRDLLIQAAAMAIVLERKGIYQSATRVADAVLADSSTTAPVREPAVGPCKECNGTGEVETGIGMMVCLDCHKASPPPPAEVPLLGEFGYPEETSAVEPVYRLRSLGDGRWIDQIKESYNYNYNYKHGHEVRVLYKAPPAEVPLTTEVPLLTEQELRSMHHIEEFGLFCDADEFEQIARAIEQAVRQKAGL